MHSSTTTEIINSKKNAPDSTSKDIKSNELIMPISLAFVKALAMQKGIAVVKTKNGFLVTQWSLSKHCSDAGEVIKHLQKMGVKV